MTYKHEMTHKHNPCQSLGGVTHGVLWRCFLFCPLIKFLTKHGRHATPCLNIIFAINWLLWLGEKYAFEACSNEAATRWSANSRAPKSVSRAVPRNIIPMPKRCVAQPQANFGIIVGVHSYMHCLSAPTPLWTSSNCVVLGQETDSLCCFQNKGTVELRPRSPEDDGRILSSEPRFHKAFVRKGTSDLPSDSQKAFKIWAKLRNLYSNFLCFVWPAAENGQV